MQLSDIFEMLSVRRSDYAHPHALPTAIEFRGDGSFTVRFKGGRIDTASSVVDLCVIIQRSISQANGESPVSVRRGYYISGSHSFRALSLNLIDDLGVVAHEWERGYPDGSVIIDTPEGNVNVTAAGSWAGMVEKMTDAYRDLGLSTAGVDQGQAA